MPTVVFFKLITQGQTVTSNSANVLWVYISSKAAVRFFSLLLLLFFLKQNEAFTYSFVIGVIFTIYHAIDF